MNTAISSLVVYATLNHWTKPEDKNWACNQILKVTGLSGFTKFLCINESVLPPLKDILKNIHEQMYAQNLLSEDDAHLSSKIDYLDANIIGSILKRPSDVTKEFYYYYEKESPIKATNWFYNFCLNSNYISKEQLAKNIKWNCKNEYGNFEITINLAKPEKDPVKIANEISTTNSPAYPKCQLCAENEGLCSKKDLVKQTLRVVPIKLCGKDFFMQYSPYSYYNEHCIVINKEHTPMQMGPIVFKNLLSFITMFPHYFIGSNAELPIVGASILSHDHYQGGNYKFAINNAKVNPEFTFPKFKNVTASVLKWPMSVIRLSSKNKEDLIYAASNIFFKWQNYSDKDVNLFCKTSSVQHSTVTSIARLNGKLYELDLILRNNITTKQHLLGVFHPHEDKHHIKKENIGLVEAMGLAILPARLKKELSLVKNTILKGKDLEPDPSIIKHGSWVKQIIERHQKITHENVSEILKQEISNIFCNILKDAGVFKETTDGRAAFQKFISKL